MKEAPGALRDLAATRTIALLTDPLLLRKGPTEPARFDDAEDFLLRVRSILHLEAGRNQNVLGHELQERTAELMGYPGADAHQRVERLMSDYFRHARIVSRSLGWARRTAPLPVGPNLGLSRDGIRFMDPIQAARNPASWMGAFEAAVEHHSSVSEEALSCIQQHVDRYRADDFFPEASDRAALRQFLKPTRGLYDRLSEMHDCGLLGRVFPEFQAISWRVVRDFYHKYTVDEHTLLTIRNLERLTGDVEPGRQRFAQRAGRAAAARAAGAVAAAARRRQVARRRPCARERAHGRGRARAACRSPARRATRCCSSSAITSGCRWSPSAATPRTRTSSRSSPTSSAPRTG